MKLITHIRITIGAILICVLGGCSISPTVDAVSWTFDGVSFILTGKSMTDHAMSAAAGKDCSMTRVVKGDAVCLPNDADVAGDRMVFAFDTGTWGDTPKAQVGTGDPLSINAAIADIAEPLGNSVTIEQRHPAVAAVTADTIPLTAFASAEMERQEAFLAQSKEPQAGPPTPPDLETRLWLPVADGAE
jgi:hypothetical protein